MTEGVDSPFPKQEDSDAKKAGLLGTRRAIKKMSLLGRDLLGNLGSSVCGVDNKEKNVTTVSLVWTAHLRGKKGGRKDHYFSPHRR